MYQKVLPIKIEQMQKFLDSPLSGEEGASALAETRLFVKTVLVRDFEGVLNYFPEIKEILQWAENQWGLVYTHVFRREPNLGLEQLRHILQFNNQRPELAVSHHDVLIDDPSNIGVDHYTRMIRHVPWGGSEVTKTTQWLFANITVRTSA